MARLNKQAIVEQLQLQDLFADATKKQITEFVEDFFDMIAERVAAGDEIAISGFGKFEKYERMNGTFKPKFSAFGDFKERVSA